MHILKIRVTATGADGVTGEIETEIHGTSGPEDARDAVRDYRGALLEALGATGRSTTAAPPIRDDHGGRTFGEGLGGGGGGGGDVPQTGRELIAWAGDRDLKPRVYKLGKAWNFPEKVLDWHRDEVRAAYDELLNEAARQAPRESRRNGYAQARS